jgi:hypothetical protein
MSGQGDHINFLVAGMRLVAPATSLPQDSFGTSEADVILKLMLTVLHPCAFTNLLLAVVIRKTSCWRRPLCLEQIGCVLLVQSKCR